MKENVHTTTIRVIYGDTDAAAVVYNANYLRYFEIGRTELMRDWVATYDEIQKLGLVLPVTECHIRFKAPAFYDDLLIIKTQIAELTGLKCKFNYRVLREDGGREKLLAKGFTVHVAVDEKGKLAKLPQEILAKLEQRAPQPE